MALPETGYLRLHDIIGRPAITKEQSIALKGKRGRPIRPRTAIPALIPVSPATWWRGVKSGRYPKPTLALGENIAAWRVEDIKELIQKASA